MLDLLRLEGTEQIPGSAMNRGGHQHRDDEEDIAGSRKGDQEPETSIGITTKAHDEVPWRREKTHQLIHGLTFAGLKKPGRDFQLRALDRLLVLDPGESALLKTSPVLLHAGEKPLPEKLTW